MTLALAWELGCVGDEDPPEARGVFERLGGAPGLGMVLERL